MTTIQEAASSASSVVFGLALAFAIAAIYVTILERRNRQ